MQRVIEMDRCSPSPGGSSRAEQRSRAPGPAFRHGVGPGAHASPSRQATMRPVTTLRGVVLPFTPSISFRSRPPRRPYLVEVMRMAAVCSPDATHLVAAGLLRAAVWGWSMLSKFRWFDQQMRH